MGEHQKLGAGNLLRGYRAAGCCGIGKVPVGSTCLRFGSYSEQEIRWSMKWVENDRRETWEVVEPRGFEPLTFSLRTRRSTN
jgi:hypothetical protein